MGWRPRVRLGPSPWVWRSRVPLVWVVPMIHLVRLVVLRRRLLLIRQRLLMRRLVVRLCHRVRLLLWRESAS